MTIPFYQDQGELNNEINNSFTEQVISEITISRYSAAFCVLVISRWLLKVNSC
jgi:hypothetical protein